MSNDFWTDERERQLAELLEAGASASEAGRALGCTKNAVIGKAYRRCIPFMSLDAVRLARLKHHQAQFVSIHKKLRIAMTAMARKREPLVKSANTCPTAGCFNTKQPGRNYCAECLRPAPKKRPWSGLGGIGMSSLGW